LHIKCYTVRVALSAVLLICFVVDGMHSPRQTCY